MNITILSEQILGVALAIGAVVIEQPADVRVAEALELSPDRVVEAVVGAVRVALLVGERVMGAVVDRPVDRRALDRDRAEDQERAFSGGDGLERAVREHAVDSRS